ncbi:Aldo-keto reductase family 1 member B10 [Pseudolycoriella hygida]|uniref:Aldo-keto reductase family 1 member B10 n=1 Tax=Pseudolycoriella hygida TaxID=35572 RepID=A0A9Q0NA07_9DIPT|nr:Aldo-keto reductase family 1 member B10 [Pseudolycoriella hygida]
MSSVPTVKLNNGYEIPVLGLGTYKALGGEVEKAVKDAIDANYRHIDTAYLYGNEAEVGNAVRAKIAEKIIKREDMFIVTKLWSNFHEPDKVEYACRLSLKNLNLDYIDLYLIHWPFSFPHISDNDSWPVDGNGVAIVNDDIDILDTYKAMERLVDQGLVRSIGLSNFNSEQITHILNGCKIKPVINQVEFSPSLNQRKLIEFCKERGIAVSAFTPLGRPNPQLKTPAFIYDDSVIEIGRKYNKTSAQVVLRYLIQCGSIPIPKSQTKERIQQNIDVFDFELNSDEMSVLDQFNTGHRIALLPALKHSKYYPFNIEF